MVKITMIITFTFLSYNSIFGVSFFISFERNDSKDSFVTGFVRSKFESNSPRTNNLKAGYDLTEYFWHRPLEFIRIHSNR